MADENLSLDEQGNRKAGRGKGWSRGSPSGLNRKCDAEVDRWRRGPCNEDHVQPVAGILHFDGLREEVAVLRRGLKLAMFRHKAQSHNQQAEGRHREEPGNFFQLRQSKLSITLLL